MKEAKDYIGITKQMKDGYFCTIIKNNGKTRVTVQYEDGTIKTHRSLKNFLNGVLEKNSIKKEHIGETRMMNCGMKCTIIDYHGSTNIDVEFEDGNISKNKTYHCFLNGKILNTNLPHNWHKVDNLKNKKFGRWTVLKYDNKKISNMAFWICQCDCGTIKSVAARDLKYGHSKSCGCLKNELAAKRCENNTKTDKLKNVYPELIKYLVDKEDGELTLGTTKSIKCICPICGKNKIYKCMKSFVIHGFNCSNCSSKISYPNKFVYKFLKHLDVEFNTEQMFDWSEKRRYDFYIPQLSCIIEAHGIQHYKDTLWSTKEYQQNNDKFKEEIALSHGIKNYIQIDCRKSNFKYIKQSILNNNQINNLFDLSKINWREIDKELKEV